MWKLNLVGHGQAARAITGVTRPNVHIDIPLPCMNNTPAERPTGAISLGPAGQSHMTGIASVLFSYSLGSRFQICTPRMRGLDRKGGGSAILQTTRAAF